MYFDLLLIAPASDTNLFSVLDQIFTEIGVSCGDDALGTFPGGGTLQFTMPYSVTK